jgi:DNA repair photolyase
MAYRFNPVKPGDGVYEWAKFSYNIGTGCSNNCLYCYACGITIEMARKDGRVFSRTDWPHDNVNPRKADIHQSVNDIVMFPSMHDINPTYLPTYISALRNIMKADNYVVIVTKPRLDCIRAICEQFQDYKERLLFRMTITSLNEELSRFWEPGAPLPEERLEALQLAYESGYQTSVSVEPMIDSVDRTVDLYQSVVPYLTEDIWFGKMNDIGSRVAMDSQEVRDAVRVIREQQSDANIHRLYQQLKGADKVAWKDSICKVVGLKTA